jgi:YYY domain-containing protein
MTTPDTSPIGTSDPEQPELRSEERWNVEHWSVERGRSVPSVVQELFAWLRTDAAVRWALVLILVVGAYLRWSHLDWDQGTHIHPDERFLTMVESALELPKSLGEFFNSQTSPMSPYNKGYGFFVYGTLPIFIVRVVAQFADKFNQVARLWTVAPDVPRGLVGYDGVHLVGRALSGLFDLGCVLLIYVVGRRLYGRRVGLLAAALLAFAVLPLQQSHFFTVDTFGTFFALLTFYFAVRVAQGGERGRRGGGWGSYVALGASLGASLACRINLAPLAGIALLAAGVRVWDDWHRAPLAGDKGPRDGHWLSTILQATLFRLFLMGIVTIAVFRVAQPYAFGGTSLLDFSLSAQWRDNMRTISQLISGDADYPPGHQWASRTPFVFPFVNMVVWGLGLPLGLTAWAGWALATWQLIRGMTDRPDGRVVRMHILPVAWIGGMFLWQGLQYVQSMRYLLPIYPLLAMMAAWLLFWLVDRAFEFKRSNVRTVRPEPAEGSKRPNVQTMSRYAPGIAYGLMALVLIGTMLWGWGFLAIYRRPLTRITASEWIYDNVLPGSVIANEHWDDGLPLRIAGKDAFGSFGYKGLSTSSDGSMQMYAEDVPEKREQLYQWLNEADYIVLSSNRLWGSIPRLPMRYPMTTLYYKLLFEGKLGFEQVLRVTSFPTIFGIQFDDTKAEEAFSVYDHPEVRIFRKTPQYSEELVRSYLDKVDLENTLQMWPKQVSAAPTGLLMTDQEAVRQRAGGTWSDIFNLDSLVNRSSLLATLVWLLLLELLGLVAFPVAFVVLRSLTDRGYGVSKTLGILVLAWLSWIGPSLKIVPYQRWWILLSLAAMIAVSAVVGWRRRAGLVEFVRSRGRLLLTEEILFLVLFFLFLLIRWGNPDLWHPARGGEKPMEFAFLNAVIKSTTFPPYDPWQAGGFMNYYYFGFVIVGTLIKLTGIVPWVAYNLAVPSLFALTGLGGFSIAYNLADGDPERETVPHATELPAVYPGGEAANAENDVGLSPEALAGVPQAGQAASGPRPDEVEGPPAGKMRDGSLLAGFAGAFFVVIVGNLGNVKLVLDQLAALSTVPVQSTLPGLPKLVHVLDGLVGWLVRGQSLQIANDWWFWNASRVIPDTINEFPFFTFTYADLHAHMIALPLTLLALAIAVALVRRADAGSAGDEPSPWRIALPDLLLIALLGFVAGSLRATNTWDFPTYILVGMAAIAVLEASRRLRMPFPEALDQRLAFLFRAAVAVIWRTVILVLVASVTFYPYTKYYATAYAGLQRWTEATTQIPDYLTVHGFFLVLVVIYLISELVAQTRRRQIPAWIRLVLPWIIGFAALLLGAGWVLGARIWLIALPLATLAAVLALGRDIPPARRLALLLIVLALAITMGVEVVRQKDDIGRMNTVFKFYMQAWVLFAVTSAFGLAVWAARALGWRPGLRRLAWAVTIVLFLGVMLYPLTAARAKVRDRFSAEASPHGLDGMAYMDKAQYFDNNMDLHLADDKAAMLWMLRNVSGSPVILEAQTPEYRWGSRYSIYTGLPTIQGWNWHERQQRSVVPSTAIERRVMQVQEIYNTNDVARAQKLLDDYNVSYVIVGPLERAYYSSEGLAKFDGMIDQGYLELVYPPGGVEPGSPENTPVRIYRVIGRGKELEPVVPSPIGPQPVPTPTALPTAAPVQEPAPTQPGAEPFLSPPQ